MTIDLLNKSAAHIAALTSPDKPFMAQLVLYHLYDGDWQAITSNKGLLHTYREMTGGDGPFVLRKPRHARYKVFADIEGRRSGKSAKVSVLAIREAFNTAHDRKLGPGEDHYVMVIAPTQDNCATVMSMIAGRLDYAKVAYQRTIKEIRIKDRPCVIRVTVANEIAPRGKTVSLAIIDEAQLLPSADEASGSDTEVIAAIKGALINLQGRLVMIGSAWTRSGELYAHYDAHFGKPNSDVCVFQYSTWQATDGKITEAETHEAITDPRLHAREFGAQFAEGSGTFLLASDIKKSLAGYGNDRPRLPGISYVMALDWATRGDYLCVVVAHLEVRLPEHSAAPPKNVLVVDCIRLVKPESGKSLDVERCARMVAEVNRRYGEPRVHRDIYSGDVLDVLFRTLGVRTNEVSSSVSSQAARFGAMGARFRTGCIELPNDVPQAVAQLTALEETLYSSGRVKYEVPRKKGNDDFPDALSYCCDPANLEGLTPGGDLVERITSTRDEAGIHIDRKYFFRRMYDGHEELVPCAPPSGTPMARKAAFERQAQGVFAPGDAEELRGAVASDYLDYSTINAPVLHHDDPFEQPWVRGKHSMQAFGTTAEADAMEGIVRDAMGNIRKDLVNPSRLMSGPGIRFQKSMLAVATTAEVDAREERMHPGYRAPKRY